MKRLLKRPESDSRILNKPVEKSIPFSMDDDEDIDAGSIVNSDEDEDKEPIKPVVVEAPKVVKKVIKKVVKKE